MAEAQVGLWGHLAEASEIIQNTDPLNGSTEPNESFHAVMRKYTDRRLNLTTSIEAHFALGVISQSHTLLIQDPGSKTSHEIR
jgi:hypothetical protein